MQKRGSPLANALKGLENVKKLKIISDKVRKPIRFISAPRFNFSLRKGIKK